MTNTKNILIAERYVGALVDLSSQGDLTFEKVSAQLNLVNETLKQSSDLRSVLVNPIVSTENKKEIVEKVFSTEIDVTVLNFLKVLLDQNRFDTFEDIYETFNKRIDDLSNIKRVNVVSAVEMSADAKSKLKSKLEEKLHSKVIIETQIDAEIIAGLIIKMEDNVIDMSLKHKLEDLSKNIVK